MVVLKSLLFSQYDELVFGFATKVNVKSSSPFEFNLSLTVGDEQTAVEVRREEFFSSLGLSKKVALQKQIHSDKVVYVEHSGVMGVCDALITDKPDLGLAVSTADCTAIFLYHPGRKVIAGIHSGWRGTANRILEKTLIKLRTEFKVNPEGLIAYIAPSISQQNYEVGKEVAQNFETRYLIPKGEKYLLDVAKINYDILRNFEVQSKNIQLSSLCSYGWKEMFHSYRRDGNASGRSLGVIAMKGNS